MNTIYIKFEFCIGSDHLRGTAAQVVVMLGQISHIFPLQKHFHVFSSKSLRRNGCDLQSARLIQAKFIKIRETFFNGLLKCLGHCRELWVWFCFWGFCFVKH